MSNSTFAIYQIREDSVLDPYKFEPLEFLLARGQKISCDAYRKCYEGPLIENGVWKELNDIFEAFNMYHPKGYDGWSLSVSDVIVIQESGEAEAFYIDRIGFVKVEDFLECGNEVWTCTDPDCNQFCCRVNSGSLCYELIQLNQHPNDEYFIARSVIDLQDYDGDEILDMLHAYGYEGTKHFIDSYSGLHWSILAEMFFEETALEMEVEGPFSEEAAFARVEEIVNESK